MNFKYNQTIDKLRVANKVEDLFPFKSLNYEKLIGEKKGLESVRVNQQYRIEFPSSVDGKKPETITIYSIVACNQTERNKQTFSLS